MVYAYASNFIWKVYKMPHVPFVFQFYNTWVANKPLKLAANLSCNCWCPSCFL